MSALRTGTLLGAILVCLVASSIAVAKIMRNTIDPVALVTDDGRHLVVTGPVVCTKGERLHAHLRVSQRTTGAVARGITLHRCTGGHQQWKVHASVAGRNAFEPGSATVVAIGRTLERGHATDAHQWLVEVTLVED